MTKPIMASVLRSAAALAVLTSTAAIAAPGDAPTAPGSQAHPQQMWESAPLPGERIDADLAYLKTALKLTDGQLRAWEPVADVLRAQAKERDAEIAARRSAMEKAAGAPPVGDLIAHLEDRQRKLAAEAEDLAKLETAVKPLYALLSPEQKKTADELLPPPPLQRRDVVFAARFPGMMPLPGAGMMPPGAHAFTP